MRRRQKPRLDAKGNRLILPPEFAEFIMDDWPGVSDYDRWDHWWKARCQWATENDAPEEVMGILVASETAPRWTPEDIARMI